MDQQPVQQAVQPTVKNYSTASLVLGILSVLTAIFWFISVILGVLAIIFGVLSTKSVGRTKAIAGIALGGIGIALSFLLILAIFLAIPALQKNTRDTVRKNDAALLASRVTEYQTNNSGQLPQASDLVTTGLVQITTVSASGTPTKTVAVYTTGKNCSGATGIHDFAIEFAQENGTTSCVGS